MPSSFDTSDSLVRLVKARDEAAWKRLTELYGPLVYHWCRKSGLNSEDSADLLQDVYRSLVKNIEGFEKSPEHGSFRAWLWTITRNRIRDHLRASSDKAHAQGGSEILMLLQSIPESEPDDDGDYGISTTDSLTRRASNIIKGEVKPLTWLAFWRSTIDNIEPADVALELGITVESVWQAKSRILRRARQLLQ